MKLNDYPNPDLEKVPNSKSAFAYATKKVKVEEKEEFVDLVQKAEFDRPAIEFNYEKKADDDSWFKPIVNKETGDIEEVSEEIYPYIPNQDLIDLVRLVQILKRPILLKGEPGSGKTQFSKAVAYEWYGENFREHYFEWHIKSTSKAADGLYTFDHIERLREAQLEQYKYKNPKGNGKGEESPAAETDTKIDLKKYRKFGPLAQAFLTSTKEKPSILLIDEIDKADIDFPNDLLLELDEKRFRIPETNEVIKAGYPPIIFITSNDERQLPEAFLRRCLFMYIKFPNPTQLKSIIEAHLPELMKRHAKFVDIAIKRFDKLRVAIDNDAADNKRVSTSELLDWLKAYDFDLKDKTTTDDIDLTEKGLERLKNYFPALLKSVPAYKREITKKS